MLNMDYKSLKKPRKARSPKRPKARKPQSCKARVLTSKPDPKAREPSPARPNTNRASPIYEQGGRRSGRCIERRIGTVSVCEGRRECPACPPPHFFLQYHGNQVKWRPRPITPDLADAPRPSFPYLSLSAHVLFSGSQSVLPPRNDTGQRRRRLRSRRHSRRSPSSKRLV